MSKFYKTEEFLKLNKKWKSELENSGFNDIEQDEQHLKRWSGEFYRKPRDSFTAKQTYFRLAGQFLHEHKFKNAMQYKIWELHTKGESLRNIAKLINRKFGTAQHYVRTLAKIMLTEYKNRAEDE